VLSTETGNLITAITRIVSSGRESGQIDHDLRLIRKPAPIPKKDPKRTKFEKYDR